MLNSTFAAEKLLSEALELNKVPTVFHEQISKNPKQLTPEAVQLFENVIKLFMEHLNNFINENLRLFYDDSVEGIYAKMKVFTTSAFYGLLTELADIDILVSSGKILNESDNEQTFAKKLDNLIYKSFNYAISQGIGALNLFEQILKFGGFAIKETNNKER